MWYESARIKAITFAEKNKDKKYERGQYQTFLNDFFNVFDLDREHVGAEFEKPIPNSLGYMDMLWPGKLLVEMKSVNKNLDKAMDEQALGYYKNLSKEQEPTHILACDFQRWYLFNKLSIKKYRFRLNELSENIGLFGFMIDKPNIHTTDPVNEQAGKIMADIHGSLIKDQYQSGGGSIEYFLTRTAFCLFADCTNIFEPNSFQKYITDTKEDGSDLGIYIRHLFEVLNTPKNERQKNLNCLLKTFRHIDGDLFKDHKGITYPEFTADTRRLLIKAGKDYDWSKVSPVIFGSMFQNVLKKGERRNIGAHYTTEENILKVIEPLFLDQLYKEYDDIKESDDPIVQYKQLQDKLASLTFFDPACGSGNFLSITYREIRLLEHQIIRKIHQLDPEIPIKSKIDVHQFYGIELERFSAKIAEVSMWMMDHLMNRELTEMFDLPKYRFPLEKKPNIICADSLEIDWNNILPADKCNYILGNPPFGGSNTISKKQRFQLVQLTNKYKIKTGALDYVTGWFIKAGEYCTVQTRIGFVSTNSICQGEHIYSLWPILDRLCLNIQFAYKSFQWTSETKGTATVSVIIIGLSKQKLNINYIYDNDIVKECKYITPYLTCSDRTIPLVKSSKSLNGLPNMIRGISTIDDGNYIFTEKEKNEFIKKDPVLKQHFKPYLSAVDFINNKPRYVLYPQKIPPSKLKKLSSVMDRVNKVKKFRLSCRSKSTIDMAKYPTLFGKDITIDKSYLLIPRVSSERRRYIPIGFIQPPTVPSDAVYIIPSTDVSLFGLLTSRLHNVWLSAVCGRLGDGFRYANGMCYNTFPVPNGGGDQINSLEPLAQNILDIRDNYKDSSLADLYDPDTMPADLLKAHQQLDKKVESLYRKEPFIDDDDRLEFLLEEYSKMVGYQSTF